MSSESMSEMYYSITVFLSDGFFILTHFRYMCWTKKKKKKSICAC